MLHLKVLRKKEETANLPQKSHWQLFQTMVENSYFMVKTTAPQGTAGTSRSAFESRPLRRWSLRLGRPPTCPSAPRGPSAVRTHLFQTEKHTPDRGTKSDRHPGSSCSRQHLQGKELPVSPRPFRKTSRGRKDGAGVGLDSRRKPRCSPRASCPHSCCTWRKGC